MLDALPAGSRGANGDLDLWLGHPGGPDLARYYATGWQGRSTGPEPAPPESETPDAGEPDIGE